MKISAFLKHRYVNLKTLIDSSELPYGAFLYVNPFNYFFLRRNLKLLNNSYYRMDGIYLVSILRLYLSKKLMVSRQSFDMTSLAPIIFDYCAKNKLSVFVSGGDVYELKRFIAIISERYPNLLWAGYCDGYQDEDFIISSVLKSNSDVALLGLGNIKQEKVATALARKKEAGRYFTCGAFISQTGKGGVINYYPAILNRLNLRWAYRFVKEPHTIYRVIRFYPAFLIAFLFDIVRR